MRSVIGFTCIQLSESVHQVAEGTLEDVHHLARNTPIFDGSRRAWDQSKSVFARRKPQCRLD